jgi:hypothetical protein
VVLLPLKRAVRISDLRKGISQALFVTWDHYFFAEGGGADNKKSIVSRNVRSASSGNFQYHEFLEEEECLNV